MPYYFKCDSDWNPIPCSDVLEWARWFETADRKVARTEVLGVTVSTVFMGITMCSPSFDDDSIDYLFEMMVFGADELIEQISGSTTDDVNSIFGKFFGFTEVQKRYKTYDEAKAGHEEMVKFVTQVLASRN